MEIGTILGYSSAWAKLLRYQCKQLNYIELQGFYLFIGEICRLTLVLSQAAVADNFDGSKELLCAVNHAQACTPDGTCEFATADAIGLPPFIEIEFDEKQISDTVDGDGEQTTPIDRQKLTDNELVLQGEQGLAWIIVISRESGKMTVAASGDDEGFVLFSACTAI